MNIAVYLDRFDRRRVFVVGDYLNIMNSYAQSKKYISLEQFIDVKRSNHKIKIMETCILDGEKRMNLLDMMEINAESGHM